MPLVLDGACSPESKKLVEEHIARCPGCQAVWDGLRQTMPEAVEFQDPGRGSAEVLRRTVRTVSLRAVWSAAGITAIVLLWMGYLWQEMLADQGNYRYFSYSFHEMCAAALIGTAAAAWIWLAALLWKNIRRRTWKQNWILLLTLAVMIGGQWYYFYQAQRTSYTGAAQVISVTDHGYQVDIQVGGERRTLETIPLVSNLLETDGTTYLINYEERKSAPGRYRLNYVWDIIINGQGEPVGD